MGAIVGGRRGSRRRRSAPARDAASVAPGAPGIDRRLDGRGLDRDGDVEVVAVAAGHRQRDRNAQRAERGEDAAVALEQAGRAELEPAEPVAFVRVGAGEVEGEAERLRRVLARRAPSSARVERGAGSRRRRSRRAGAMSRSLAALRNGKFFAPCSEIVNTLGVAGEDRRRAVALVDVEVDDDDPAAARLRLQQPRRDGDVVEDAVAAAARRRRVMRAAGEIGGDALDERGARGRDGRADRAARALDHLLAPRKADRALLGGAERARRSPPRRSRVVDAQADRRRSAGCGLVRVEVGERRDALAQEPVLGARKAVPGRQRQEVPVGVEGLHRRRLCGTARPRAGARRTAFLGPRH